jgi:hypothetical protein
MINLLHNNHRWRMCCLFCRMHVYYKHGTLIDSLELSATSIEIELQQFFILKYSPYGDDEFSIETKLIETSRDFR